jgi:hypothetical protein
MAKGSAKPKRERAPVMFTPAARDRLKVVATERGCSIEEAVEKYLNPVIDREYRKVLARGGRRDGVRDGDRAGA